MAEYIIVKYAREFPNGKAPVEASVAWSFSAKQAGVDTHVYPLKSAAEKDIKKLNVINPGVGYGVAEVEE